MKKRFVLIAAAIVLLVPGCGQSGVGVEFGPDDLSLIIGGTAYRCDVDIQEVIADLGEDYEYAEGMSCDYDGLDKTFRYDVAAFYTNPLEQGDLVNEIYTENATVTTSRGIAVGAGREDVIAAYGTDYEDAGDLLIYSLPNERASLCFELDGGAVWAIFLTTQPV